MSVLILCCSAASNLCLCETLPWLCHSRAAWAEPSRVTAPGKWRSLPWLFLFNLLAKKNLTLAALSLSKILPTWLRPCPFQHLLSRSCVPCWYRGTPALPAMDKGFSGDEARNGLMGRRADTVGWSVCTLRMGFEQPGPVEGAPAGGLE